MNLKIIEEKDNKVFNRKEVKSTIHSEKFPSRNEAIKALSEKFSTPEINIKIKKIYGNFGSNTFTIESNLYHSHKDKDFLEVKKKKEKAEAA